MIRPEAGYPGSISSGSAELLHLNVQCLPVLGILGACRVVQFSGCVGLHVGMLVGSGKIPVITGEALGVDVRLDLAELMEV